MLIVVFEQVGETEQKNFLSLFLCFCMKCSTEVKGKEGFTSTIIAVV